jgi:hypothetical protein
VPRIHFVKERALTRRRPRAARVRVPGRVLRPAAARARAAVCVRVRRPRGGGVARAAVDVLVPQRRHHARAAAQARGRAAPRYRVRVGAALSRAACSRVSCSPALTAIPASASTSTSSAAPTPTTHTPQPAAMYDASAFAAMFQFFPGMSMDYLRMAAQGQPLSPHQQVSVSPQALQLQPPAGAMYQQPTAPSVVVPPQWNMQLPPPPPQQQQQQQQQQQDSSAMSDIVEIPAPTAASPPAPPPTQPAAPTETPQQKRAKFLAALQPRLYANSSTQANPFSGAGAVAKLVGIVDAYGFSRVDAPTRMEILSKIRDAAGNNYFRAWAENEDAMELTRSWLKAAAAADRDEKGAHDELLPATLMPLLSASRARAIEIVRCADRSADHRPAAGHARRAQEHQDRQDRPPALDRRVHKR